MRIVKTELVVEVVWVIAVVGAGVAANVDSVTNWIVLGGVALLGPTLMRRFWRSPSKTMSESIRDAIQ